jgi:putative toxin-antitoxin system antitoxin component (TIGR02293 family)
MVPQFGYNGPDEVNAMAASELVRDVLGVKEATGSSVNVHQLVQRGLLKKNAEKLFKRPVHGQVSYRQLRQSVIPESTWKKTHARLSPELSEKVARISRLMAMAIEALGDEASALEWMLRPHSELDYNVPATLLKTEAGARAVEGILAKLLYGLPV